MGRSRGAVTESMPRPRPERARVGRRGFGCESQARGQEARFTIARVPWRVEFTQSMLERSCIGQVHCRYSYAVGRLSDSEGATVRFANLLRWFRPQQVARIDLRSSVERTLLFPVPGNAISNDHVFPCSDNAQGKARSLQPRQIGGTSLDAAVVPTSAGCTD